jgi:hypothetical protein
MTVAIQLLSFTDCQTTDNFHHLCLKIFNKISNYIKFNMQPIRMTGSMPMTILLLA